MHWYTIHTFKDRLESIEQFFVEIAANEEQLITFGFKHAMTLPSAENAVEALRTFDEDFAKLKRYMLRMDRALGQELEYMDSEGKLTEQVSLIALRLRMSDARKPMSGSLSAINNILLFFPYISTRINRKELFGAEPLSLHKTIINLGRLRSLATICSDLISKQDTADDEVFKPSNVKHDHVLDLIDNALADVEKLISISPTERTRIEGYLQEAKKEVLSPSPSWSKIVGALVIVAAITSGIADAPNAAKNINDAIEYILGTSVEKPLHKYLPLPSDNKKPQIPIGTLA